MEKLLKAANRYIETSDWKTVSVLKFCLISLGLLAGTRIAEKFKKRVFWGALSVFVVTYIPLMVKLLRILTEKEET